MPYRRLPGTDAARIRTMETAIDKIRYSDYYAPVISPDILTKAERLLYEYKNAETQYLANLSRQMAFSHSDQYQNRFKTAKMYVTHFLLVFNMCVKRNEFKTSDRTYYSLPEDMSELPDLSTETAVLRWCENVIRGERERTARGGIPVYNPSMAKLAVHYDLFNEQYQQHESLRRFTDESLQKVAGMRPSVDAMILEMWNSIERYFADKQGSERIEKCREYGIIYYYRKGEQTD